MVHDNDIKDLQTQLEELRSMQLAGTLSERRVWTVMQRASTLLDEAQGSPLQECIEVIFHLLSSIWSNTRNKARLADLKQAL
ncbi:hypothetical protein KS4_26990 [Poriferisphaera corsica]|uniref:Uncharacterized protein n=1 Tax=Poriferisphaera corsica TaxID=2528020 RepID=A0A517YWM1_9BACT|nr:hypothetical protein [Poriferisphaera corsica]QDU34628.1 hypothetical protein KS4_26990 [Poriferisphaera corsica]